VQIKTAPDTIISPHFQLDTGLSTADMRSRIANGNVDADGFVNLR
jgi:hypothetical protein